MDNSCIEWGSNCGEVTNCVLYNTDAMRHTLCYFVAACLVLATLADFGVWWNSGNIELFDEEENTKQDTDVKVKGESNIGLEMETS